LSTQAFKTSSTILQVIQLADFAEHVDYAGGAHVGGTKGCVTRLILLKMLQLSFQQNPEIAL